MSLYVVCVSYMLCVSFVGPIPASAEFHMLVSFDGSIHALSFI